MRSTSLGHRPSLFGIAALAFALMLGTSTSAHAEAYDYWSLWTGENGKWAAATTGAAEIELSDGSVLAARYVRTEASLTEKDAPTEKAAYEALCPDSQPQEGQTRVAVVLDYGDASIAPEGSTPPGNAVECVYVASPASGSSALDANAEVSQDASGFITAINGYPGSGGDANTTEATSDPIPEDTDSSTPWAWIIGVSALVIVAILVGLASSRRRSGGDADADPSV